MIKLKSITLAALLVLASITGAAQPAAANPISDALEDEEDESLLPSADAIVSAAQGLADRARDAIDRSDPPPADDAAQDAADAFNANNGTLEDYLNDRTTADTDYDVIEITFEIDDETATRYLVADVDNETYANAEMVNDTDRTVDETITLRDKAAENASDEIEFFAEEYAAEDRSVDDAYLSRLASRYGTFGPMDDLVETSFEI